MVPLKLVEGRRPGRGFSFLPQAGKEGCPRHPESPPAAPVRGAAAIREILGLRPIPEFERWLEKMGIMENGRLTARAGDPTIFAEGGGSA